MDKADYSSSWMNLFGELQNITTEELFRSILNVRKHNEPRLPLYDCVPDDKNTIPGEIAFRICAIREMFEEAGVLLARNCENIETVATQLPGSFKPAVKILPESLRQHWRERVHSNANEFLVMCRYVWTINLK